MTFIESTLDISGESLPVRIHFNYQAEIESGPEMQTEQWEFLELHFIDYDNDCIHDASFLIGLIDEDTLIDAVNAVGE
tara:strand:+ start:1540 stop:1773 length:234 start_codon:yes stop_codon:yes gene_type:complete